MCTLIHKVPELFPENRGGLARIYLGSSQSQGGDGTSIKRITLGGFLTDVTIHQLTSIATLELF